MIDPEIVARIMSVASVHGGDGPISPACEEALDELVHDVKSGEAAEINNNGVEAQVEFLIGSGLSEDEIVSALEGG